jgi:hypothetical protein
MDFCQAQGRGADDIYGKYSWEIGADLNLTDYVQNRMK